MGSKFFLLQSSFTGTASNIDSGTDITEPYIERDKTNELI
jgi:hypothetical protein